MALSHYKNDDTSTILFKPNYNESNVEYISYKYSKTINGVTEEVSKKVPKLPYNTTTYLFSYI